MAKAVTVQDLRAFELFRGLTAKEREAVLPLCRWERFDAEETFVVEGTAADTFYAIVEGRIAVEMKVQFGAQALSRQATTQVLPAGQYCGYSVLVPPYIYTSSGVCIEPTRLIAIDGKGLRRLAAENSQLGYQFMRTIARMMATRMLRTRNTLIHTLSILSHDLKSPLVAVQSYLEVMAGGFVGDVSDEQKEMLQRSIIRIDELLNLISDILDVSRIETGRLEQEWKPMSLAEVARRALADAWGAANAKSIELTYDLADGTAPMVGADRRIQQVLDNLLSNSVKYSPERAAVHLRIRDEETHWRVDVSDTGVGISSEETPFIFDDFYRAKDATVGGSGLGLAIAKKIIAAHRGKIWVESPDKSSGTGSCFSFILPKDLKPYTPKSKEEADE